MSLNKLPRKLLQLLRPSQLRKPKLKHRLNNKCRVWCQAWCQWCLQWCQWCPNNQTMGNQWPWSNKTPTNSKLSSCNSTQCSNTTNNSCKWWWCSNKRNRILVSNSKPNNNQRWTQWCSICLECSNQRRPQPRTSNQHQPRNERSTQRASKYHHCTAKNSHMTKHNDTTTTDW